MTGTADTVAARLRIAWALATLLVVEALICGVAALPVVFLWIEIVIPTEGRVVRLIAAALTAVPSYTLFALCLMPVSALATRALGWKTPAGVSLAIDAFDWPLLTWARAMAVAYIVRLFAGSLFRTSPLWTAYLRLSGARIGQRVYVNSLAVSDYNLLEFGDDVVIGDAAHVSGHTVEGGVLKTGRVRLGSGVTVGVGAIIDIGVTVGSGCQIAALSVVPKHTTLEPGGVYVGVPAQRLK